MQLSKFPRKKYTDGYTPIERLENLTEVLNGPNIFIKRDDLLGLTAGGNKTRKLEFLIADALKSGADTVITCGAVQSNHCRLTLSAAVKEGLKCQLVLEERVPKSFNPEGNGNHFLFKLLGVEKYKVVQAGANMLEEMKKLADELHSSGRKAYIIPGGGSNEIGALGYVSCAQEILQQTFDLGVHINHVVTASGSGGTHAGLAAGFHGNNSNLTITGINVSRPNSTQIPLIHQLANKTLSHLGVPDAIPIEKVRCFDDYVGDGYSLPTDSMIEAVQMLARTEGILLDPVYSGKAMAGLIDLVRSNYFQKSDHVLFIHTGGAPALYAHTETFERNLFNLNQNVMS